MAERAFDSEGRNNQGGRRGIYRALDIASVGPFESPWLLADEPSVATYYYVTSTPISGGTSDRFRQDWTPDPSITLINLTTAGSGANAGSTSITPTTDAPVACIQYMRVFGSTGSEGPLHHTIPAGTYYRFRFAGAVSGGVLAVLVVELIPVRSLYGGGGGY